jgi:hypothetical protein
MFNSQINKTISDHQQCIRISPNFQKQNLRHYLTLISNNTIFSDFSDLLKEIKDIPIWSPRLCWLAGCYTTSNLDIISHERTGSFSKPTYDDIRCILTDIYDTLMTEKKVVFYNVYSFLSTLQSSLLQYSSDPGISFTLSVVNSLCKLLGSVDDTYLSTEIILTDVNYTCDKIKTDLKEISVTYLLIDTVISLTKMFETMSVSITFFIFAPNIQFIVFGGIIKNELHCTVLAVLEGYMTIIDREDVQNLLGIITVFKSVDALNRYIEFLEQKEDYSARDEIARYRNIYTIIKSSPGFLKGVEHKTFFFNNSIEQILTPIHYKIDAQQISMCDLIEAMFTSYFLTSDVPGIIDEETGKILSEKECTREMTTWYNICLFYLSPYMNMLGSDIYAFQCAPKPVTEIYQLTFILTAGHFFLCDEDIIRTFWSKSYYWKTIPFHVELFFLADVSDTTDHTIYSLSIPDINDEFSRIKLYVNKLFKIMSENQHRELDPATYTLMIYAQVDASVRSYILLQNVSDKDAIQALCPILNTNYTSVMPVSLSLKDNSTQYSLILQHMGSHGKIGKEQITKHYKTLFPTKMV